jgi:hypothetical protein
MLQEPIEYSVLSVKQDVSETTFAPRVASSKAIPAPMPLEAPVTTAVFPAKGRYECCDSMARDDCR